jgi:hypothetical protein
MKYLTIHKKQAKQKSQFWKWLRRILFIAILFLLFLQFHHYQLAIDALQQVNLDQLETIHNLQRQVTTEHLHNVNLQNINTDLVNQIHELKVKINGLELKNIHNSTSSLPVIQDVHIDKELHNDVLVPVAVTVTTGAFIVSLLSKIASFMPVSLP